jgi:hypothetical protein
VTQPKLITLCVAISPLRPFATPLTFPPSLDDPGPGEDIIENMIPGGPAPLFAVGGVVTALAAS